MSDVHMEGLDADTDETITLIASDEIKFEVDRKDVLISVLVKTILENDENADSVPIPGVKGETLGKVVQYMKHHEGTEPPQCQKPLRSAVMKEVCEDEWDATYIDGVSEDVKDLYSIILAANYMDINGLLNLCAAKVASLVKNKSPEEIEQILNP